MPVTPVNIAPTANASSTAITAVGVTGRGTPDLNIWLKGDSIVWGSPGTTTQATDNWPLIFGKLYQAAYKQNISSSNVNVVNLGVGGSDQIEDDQLWGTDPAVKSIQNQIATLGYVPHMIGWGYGTNDLNKGINNVTTSGEQAVEYFYQRTLAAGQLCASLNIEFFVLGALCFPNSGQDSVTVNDRYENKWIWAFNEGGRLAARDLGKRFIPMWQLFMDFMAATGNPSWKVETLYKPETNMVHPSTIGAAMQAGIVAQGLLPQDLFYRLDTRKPQHLLYNDARSKYPLDEGTRNTFAGYDSSFVPTVANITGSDDLPGASKEIIDTLVYNHFASAALYVDTIDNSGAGVGVIPPTILIESYTNTPVTTVFSGNIPGSGVASGAGLVRQFLCNLPMGMSRIRLISSATPGLDFKGGNFYVEPGIKAGRGTFVQAAGLVESATATTAVLPASSITGSIAVGNHIRIVAGTTVQQAAITGWNAGTRTVTVASWPGGTPTTSSQFVVSQVLYTGATPAGTTNEEFYWYSDGKKTYIKFDFLYATATGTSVTQYDIPIPVGCPVPYAFAHQSANGSVLKRWSTTRPGSTVTNNSISSQLNHYLRRDSSYPSGFQLRSTSTAAIVGHIAEAFDYDNAVGAW